MDFRSYRIKSPVKSFRDLEVYQKTIQLSDEITNLPFLSKERFQKDNEEIRQIAEKIPKLIAEAYGDKFDSRELAHKKLTEAITLITNAVTKIDLLRQRFAEDREPAPALSSSKNLPKLPDNNSSTSALPSNNPIPKLPIKSKPLSQSFHDNNSLAEISRADVPPTEIGNAEIRKSAKETLDNLLTRYQTQKVKVLNLRKAWQRVFTDFNKDEAGKTNWRK